MSQQYSLRWNNHQPNFISMFTSLLNTQTLVDVTLAAEGKHLLAHKVVLSACSNYFQALFMENPSRHPIVILKDVKFADLRTMVDFMYYGEVNVTEEQLPQVLDTAKTLKIKGLTEMPESLTRSQGTSADMQQERHSVSPPTPTQSPTTTKRKRRSRVRSTGSPQLNLQEEPRQLESQSVDLVRGDAITLSSVPQRRRDFDDRLMEAAAQQPADQQNMAAVDQLAMDSNPANLAQGGQWSMMEHTYPRYSNACLGTLQPDANMYMNNVMNQHMGDMGSSEPPLRLRRTKYLLKRQSHVDDHPVRKQVSEPGPQPPPYPLVKHESYPQYSKNRRIRTQDKEVGSLLIRAVTVIDRQPSTSSSVDVAESHAHRASHTPAVRSGPPLSCNFCWNTVDECGRILRRKTQYHCPECRTNLCIVPCFHEYHDGPESDAGAGAAANAR